MNECLLLTATINPNASIGAGGYRSTSLDPEKRYFEYLDALAFYLVRSGFSKIVFCENSNYPVRHADDLHKLASALGKEFEMLQFEGDHRKTVELGYGYGDGECIDYAVEHSSLIRSANNWYKCSGRYKIENIDSVVSAYEKEDRVFFKGF